MDDNIINKVILSIAYDIDRDTYGEVVELAEQLGVPTSLLVESFIISKDAPEGAFPYSRAETFLDHVINDIHGFKGMRVESCIDRSDSFKISLEMSPETLSEKLR